MTWFMCRLEILGLELCLSPELHRSINIVIFFLSILSNPSIRDRETGMIERQIHMGRQIDRRTNMDR